MERKILQRSTYIIISISLFLLLPSIYGITYCILSERIIVLASPLEADIANAIFACRNKKLICRRADGLSDMENIITADEINKLSETIIYSASSCYSRGLSQSADEFFRRYFNFFMKINCSYTSNINILRNEILKLKHHLFEIRRKSEGLFCHSDDEEDEVGIELLPPGGGESEYTPLLRQRLLEKYGQRESLESGESRAQENLKNHIAKLKEYLHTIRAARLAHEPYRPMIRFIGWSWLIFESVGMVLLLCAAYVEFKSWRKKKAGREE
jgi:hypothetical protein